MDRDIFLISRMKLGDEGAVSDFVKKYYKAIYQYCYYRLANQWLAEDITQETFANFFKKFNTYIHQGKAKNLLYVIAGNLCKNEYKKHREMSFDALEFEPVEKNNEQDKVSLKNGLWQELSRLPEEYRIVIILYFFQDLKLREIAEILEIRLSLVKYRLYEGKKVLKNNIDREDFYD